MKEEKNIQTEARKTIGIFLSILSVLTFIVYYSLITFRSGIFIGPLMMSPALAAILTLLVQGKPITSMPWGIKDLKYLKMAYFTPVLYITVAYLLLWSFGFGGVFEESTLTKWAKQLGIVNTTVAALVMVGLLGTVQVIKNLGSTFGEEIGWRGFFIFELRKVLSFEGVSIISGLIWAMWHYPIIIYFVGGNKAVHLIAFTVMIVGMSVILAYYTFKSNSLVPAALFHSVHNIYIQKIFTPLTITNKSSDIWIDEYGFMIPIITTITAIYFWRKAKAEGM